MKPYSIGLIIAMTIFIVLFIGCVPHNSIVPGPNVPIPPAGWSLLKSLSQVGILPFLSIITIGLGVFLAVKGSAKTGIALVVSGLVTLFISLACVKYAGVIALLGLLGAIGLLVWQFLLHRKALEQVVLGVEKVKKSPSLEISTFPGFVPEGCKTQKDVINTLLTKDIQTPATQQLVKEIKDEQTV